MQPVPIEKKTVDFRGRRISAGGLPKISRSRVSALGISVTSQELREASGSPAATKTFQRYLAAVKALLGGREFE